MIECARCGRIIWGYPCLWCDLYEPYVEGYDTYGEATSTYVNISAPDFRPRER